MTNIEQLEAAGDNLEGLAVQRLGADPGGGGRLAAARALPAPAAQSLVATAKEAFVHGSNVANIVAALVAIGGSLLAMRYLPRRP